MSPTPPQEIQNPCRLCHTPATPVARQKILRRHDVTYLLCPNCDLLQTEKPYWLDEAYDPSIAILDTGAVDRNLLCADLTRVLAFLLGIRPTHPCLDFGAGHGVFVRRMRDHGLNFRWADKFATNLYARGFEAPDPAQPHALVTAFEVFEHFDDVHAETHRLLSPGHQSILISTFLHKGHRENWWYYVPEVGQHITFFSKKTMSHIAAQYNYHPLCGPAFTLLLRNPTQLANWRLRLIQRILNRHRYRQSQSPWIKYLLPLLPKHPSLIEQDQAHLRQAA